MTSLITQDETAFGPLIFMMRQLQTLGGTSSIPYDRAQNFYRYAGSVATVKGNHRITSGFSTVREQLNGIESSGHGGMILFSSNFGRDMITNVRLGTPTQDFPVGWHAASRLPTLAHAVLRRRHLDRAPGT